MKEKKAPYVPTRTCPHRWCKPLHLIPLPFALAVIAFDLWHNWLFLLVLAAGIAMSVVVPKLIHYKPRPRSAPATLKDVVEDIRQSPSAFDLEMQDALYEGTGWRSLEVRKGWARVAVACDALLVALIGLSVTVIFAAPQEAAQSASRDPDVASWVSLLIGAAFFGFSLYAHKKATQPRKPKRAWVPAFLRTSS